MEGTVGWHLAVLTNFRHGTRVNVRLQTKSTVRSASKSPRASPSERYWLLNLSYLGNRAEVGGSPVKKATFIRWKETKVSFLLTVTIMLTST